MALAFPFCVHPLLGMSPAFWLYQHHLCTHLTSKLSSRVVGPYVSTTLPEYSMTRQPCLEQATSSPQPWLCWAVFFGAVDYRSGPREILGSSTLGRWVSGLLE